jgi:sugar/nucleoside kinase (ribokinase family)
MEFQQRIIKQTRDLDSNLATKAVGSSCIEFITGKDDFVRDGMTTLDLHEQVPGGAGLCNALALTETGLSKNISLYTVLGESNITPGIADGHGQEILSYAKQKGIDVQFQTTSQVPTEFNIVMLDPKDGVKYGARIAKDGMLAREFFESESFLQNQTNSSDQVFVLSSLSPLTGMELFTRIEKMRPGSLKIWSLNNSTAKELAEGPITKPGPFNINADILMMNENEFECFESIRHPALKSVKIVLVTLGDNGSKVYLNKGGGSFDALTAPSYEVKSINTNGAGEAMHANFLGSFLKLMGDESLTSNRLPDIIQTSLCIGNYAAALKVSKTESSSLYFPDILKSGDILQTAYDLNLNPTQLHAHLNSKIASRAYVSV